jgi:hypothetical protein
MTGWEGVRWWEGDTLRRPSYSFKYSNSLIIVLMLPFFSGTVSSQNS